MKNDDTQVEVRFVIKTSQFNLYHILKLIEIEGCKTYADIDQSDPVHLTINATVSAPIRSYSS